MGVDGKRHVGGRTVRAMSAPASRLLNREDAAGYVSVSLNTLDRLVEDGILPKPHRIYARVIRFDRKEIDAALDKMSGINASLDGWDDV
jgi:predicted DNA-binding transcriptional regulator AlpA